MAVGAAIAAIVIAAGAAVYQGEATKKAAKVQRRQQEKFHREQTALAVSEKRSQAMRQRRATQRKPDVEALLAAEQTDRGIGSTILAGGKLGRNSALGTVSQER